MVTIFMNSKNSKTSDPHRLLLNLSDKMNLFYQTLVFNIHEKILKSHTKVIGLKYQFQNGMKSLNYLMDHIRYQIFKITLNIS